MNKKTVGVITFHDTRNYGAVLQMFALQQVLYDLGYIPSVIDYRNQNHYYGKISIIRKLKHRCWAFVVDKILGASRWRKTTKFIHKNIRLTPISYLSYAELKRTPPQFDFYITGSDQVWNPACIHGDPAFFLDFAPTGHKRISYAASFGVAKLSDDTQEQYRTLLLQFSACSVREKAGLELFQSMNLKKEPVLLPDPVFLLDSQCWGQLDSTLNIDGPYLLCYTMPGDIAVEAALFNAAEKIASRESLQIIHIGLKEYRRFPPNGRAIWNAGPQDFVNLIKNAAFIVTNSFHGTAFSIIFEKRFYAFYNRKRNSASQYMSRLESLTELCQLQSRLLDIQVEGHTFSMESIDYTSAKKYLQMKEDEAISYLKENLS